MIFPLALCLGVIVAAAADTAAGINKTIVDLDIMAMANVSETLVVVKRKHTTETKLRCHSARKTGKMNETFYNYTLRAGYSNGAQYQYVEQQVEVKLVPLRSGRGYRSKYTDRDGVRFSLRLRNMSEAGDCFVIMVNKTYTSGTVNMNSTRGCELLVPASKVTEEIPAECDTYYNETCKGDSLQLYQDDCIYDQVSSDPGC
uniref:Putative secreted protein n=1 Tax=Amblyomma americanum TaxID=6943 RepID=A0A0C9RXV7_AMBAM